MRDPVLEVINADPTSVWRLEWRRLLLLDRLMKRAFLVRDVLADCYCRLQPSTLHGIGVFAVRDIPRNKNPFRMLARYARPGYVRITEEELEALPHGLAGTIRALFVPTDGAMYVPTCGTNLVYLIAYLNHSDMPNLRTRDGFNFFTRRKICEGEELTVDYHTYGASELLLRT